MLSNIVTGSVTGTGADIDITLGFIPSKVEVLNVTASDFCGMQWFSTLPDAYGIKRLTSTWTKITSLGITPLGGAAGATKLGFRIGADTDLNVAAEVMHWVAYRNGPGSGA